MLLVAQVLLSSCTAFFDPAVPALIPQLVERNQLPRANSQTQFVAGMATIIGPVLGGLTVAWAGYVPVFLFNAGSYFISAGFESFIQLPPSDNTASVQAKLTDQIREGCRYVYDRTSLTIILVMVGIIHFFVGSIEAVIPVLATDLTGRGAENIGYIQAGFGLGTVVAALYISIRNLRQNEARVLFGSVFLIGLALLVIGGIHLAGLRMILPYLILFPTVGGLIIFAGTSFRSMIQKEVENRMLGRVFGFVASVGNISIPLAMLFYGVILEYVPHSLILAASGLTLLPVSLFSYQRYMTIASGLHQQELGS